MQHLIYIIFAWLSLLIVILLLALFPVSRLAAKKQNKYLRKTKSLLLQWHKLLGVLLIFVILIHGKTAMKRPGIEANAILLLAIILLVSYLIRKRSPKTWLYTHRFLSVLFILAVLIHLLKALD